MFEIIQQDKKFLDAIVDLFVCQWPNCSVCELILLFLESSFQECMLFIQYFVNILVHRLPKGIIEKLCSIAPLILQSYSEYNIFVLTYTLKLVSSLAQLCTFSTSLFSHC